jgi:hypothetical protein
LLLVTLGREVGPSKDCWEEKGNTSLGVTGASGMRDDGLDGAVGT